MKKQYTNRLILVRREGEALVHVRGPLTGKARCGALMPPDQVERVKPVDAQVRDLCQECMAAHMRRKNSKPA